MPHQPRVRDVGVREGRLHPLQMVGFPPIVVVQEGDHVLPGVEQGRVVAAARAGGAGIQAELGPRVGRRGIAEVRLGVADDHDPIG